jgi:type II secretory pathway component GspD/PulD (secretin)
LRVEYVGADEVALIRSGVAIALLWSIQAMAQYPLEIIPLRHSTVEQVLPALRPLLDQGATLSGQSGQLFVRTSPANLAELKQALEAIDRPRRRLQILVRFDDATASQARELGASGVISNRGSRVEIRAQDSGGAADERIDQRVQVLEGGQATIFTGQSRTLPQRQVTRTPGGVTTRETYTVQEAQTGFQVSPRVAGGMVHLDIAPQREALGPGGTVQSQRTATTASGRLGEWFELSGLGSSAARDERGIGASAQSRSTESRRVWVKVEELRN